MEEEEEMKGRGGRSRFQLQEIWSVIFVLLCLLCLVVSSSSLSLYLSITLLFPKSNSVMFNVSLFQLLCEVKQRAIEELQLQEQPPGKLLGVKFNCLQGASWPASSLLLRVSYICRCRNPVGICFNNTAK